MADDTPKPFHNPFGALAGWVKPGAASSSPTPESAARPETPGPKARAIPGPARAVVRLERSGRGGKEVTVIEQLGLPPAQREVWLKHLKSGLGCGGTLEGDALVLQGDQRKRAPALLTARGVRRVTLG